MRAHHHHIRVLIMEKDPTKNPSLVGSGRRSHHIGVRIMEKDPTTKNLLTVKGLVGSGSWIGAPQNTHHTSKRMDFRERPIRAHAAAPPEKSQGGAPVSKRTHFK